MTTTALDQTIDLQGLQPQVNSLQQIYGLKNHTATLIAVAQTIITRLRTYNIQTLTIRQLHYQMVSHCVGLMVLNGKKTVPLYANTDKYYRKLDRALTTARKQRIIPWQVFVDRSRPRWANKMTEKSIASKFIDPEKTFRQHILTQLRDEWEKTYSLPKWFKQPQRVVVLCEKDALAGVFVDICEEWEVPFFVGKGYSSITVRYGLWEQIRTLLETVDDGEPVEEVIVLAFGDHDPSGLDIIRLMGEEGTEEVGAGITVEHSALTQQQIHDYNLVPIPTKDNDPRTDGYRDQYGDEACELDAIPPPALQSILRNAIEEYYHPGVWEHDVQSQIRAWQVRFMEEREEATKTIIEATDWDLDEKLKEEEPEEEEQDLSGVDINEEIPEPRYNKEDREALDQYMKEVRNEIDTLIRRQQDAFKPYQKEDGTWVMYEWSANFTFMDKRGKDAEPTFEEPGNPEDNKRLRELLAAHMHFTREPDPLPPLSERGMKQWRVYRKRVKLQYDAKWKADLEKGIEEAKDRFEAVPPVPVYDDRPEHPLIPKLDLSKEDQKLYDAWKDAHGSEVDQLISDIFHRCAIHLIVQGAICDSRDSTTPDTARSILEGNKELCEKGPTLSQGGFKQWIAYEIGRRTQIGETKPKHPAIPELNLSEEDQRKLDVWKDQHGSKVVDLTNRLFGGRLADLKTGKNIGPGKQVISEMSSEELFNQLLPEWNKLQKEGPPLSKEGFRKWLLYDVACGVRVSERNRLNLEAHQEKEARKEQRKQELTQKREEDRKKAWRKQVDEAINSGHFLVIDQGSSVLCRGDTLSPEKYRDASRRFPDLVAVQGDEACKALEEDESLYY
jgi:hypothetical protein